MPYSYAVSAVDSAFGFPAVVIPSDHESFRFCNPFSRTIATRCFDPVHSWVSSITTNVGRRPSFVPATAGTLTSTPDEPLSWTSRSNTSKNSRSGPSDTAARTADISRSAWSYDAAAATTYGSTTRRPRGRRPFSVCSHRSNLTGPAISASATHAANSVFRDPFGRPRTARLTSRFPSFPIS